LTFSFILNRFPGGESYRDLIRRLINVAIEIEQQVIPTLVLSHVSILQCLMAYFRNSPVEQCMSIEVPMHTVIKFTPVRGGGWSETQHPLFDETSFDGIYTSSPSHIPLDSSSIAKEPHGSSRKGGVVSVESSSEISLLGDEETVPIWGDGRGSAGVRTIFRK
jgi:hypothetical protein